MKIRNFYRNIKLFFKYDLKDHLKKTIFASQQCAYIQGKVIAKQRYLLLGKGRIIFNGKVQFGFFPSPYFFSTYAHIEARNETASVVINEGTVINNNACITAEKTSITIGQRCRIGTNFICLDSDGHGLSIKNRDNPEKIICKAVVIGDDVFIGSNVCICKGVVLGNGVVVGMGSVVTKSFPANSIIAGNPAKLIRYVDNA